MSPVVKSALLLVVSNVFMTLAWYGHLRFLEHRPWFVAAFLSWNVAFAEYLFQVPGNRIGATRLSLPQLKVMQEVITLVVFVPIAFVLFGTRFRLDHVWAALCLCGAVFFAFRGGVG